MYGYREKRPFISMQAILERVKQEEIIQMALGFYPQEHRYINSPFRTDNNPDCYFEWYNGWLWFIDWGSNKSHRDCFNIVQDKLGLSFYESLQLINSHFKLNLESEFIKPKTKKVKKVIVENKVIPKDITFKTRPFNNTTDKDFWNGYGISKKNLMEDNVFPIIWYRVYSKKLKTYIAIRPDTRSYAITGFNKRVKIYTPDVVGKGKWVTNCKSNDIGGFETLKSGETLVISKSYKDYRVLKNEGLSVIWFQNEGMIPDEEILIPILSKFNRVVVFFDNDSTGIEQAQNISDYINSILPNRATPLTLPTHLLEENISDPSDLYKLKGREHLLSFLIQQKLK